MAKRKRSSKRSVSSVPKGLPVKNAGSTNPFEATAGRKRPKFHVHNRPTSKQRKEPSKLAQAIEKRQQQVKKAFIASKKANVFADHRIGEYNDQMTTEEKNLSRLVKERNRQSKRNTKYSLDDDAVLTHRGKAVDGIQHHVVLSDDDSDGGDLDAADTTLHFGGGERKGENQFDYYGRGDGNATERMSQLYEKRKMDLDDVIMRRKVAKAEKMQSKEHQVERFAAIDEAYEQLATHLQFRDKEKEIRKYFEDKRSGKLSGEDAEMADWDREMKGYLYMDRKVKAVDRTKTPEEIAKEEADKLHELETRRLARMNGDFDDDDLSDVSVEGQKRSDWKRKKKARTYNPEELSDSDDEDDTEKETIQFTSEGLVRLNKDGEVVGKAGEKDVEPGDMTAADLPAQLTVGTRVSASYRAKEQFDGNESWFTGAISAVHESSVGNTTYNVEYDDGDFEEGVEPEHIRLLPESQEELEKKQDAKDKEKVVKEKRRKAKEQARTQLPFVFEVPRTLDALHDMIAEHASTGADVSLIIKRIYKANSVKLDHRNTEKMQNYYDVLLRRFIAVGDAIYQSGDGGETLARYNQLDSLLEVLYDMAQDSPEIATAVWGRRLGILQSAHAKRLRDVGFVQVQSDKSETAYPSTGVVLALRAVGHIFPATDMRHQIVTPTLLLLGQIIAQTPIMSAYDLMMGTVCSGLIIELTAEAKRFSPEAHAFLAGVIRLFAPSEKERRLGHPLASMLQAAGEGNMSSLRNEASSIAGVPQLSIEEKAVESKTCAASILQTALKLVEASSKSLTGSLNHSEMEVFAEVSASILTLNPKSKRHPLPAQIQATLSSTVEAVSECMASTRPPVQRRSGPTVREKSIKSLAPRLEHVDKYAMSKDKGKSVAQAAADRARREYKREHKAVARELRMDAVMTENERRRERDQSNAAAKAKRHKAFAWMESEQATMNQQVRQGGGLLQGGGMGAARAKAASGKLGVKKGGKF